MLLGAFAVKSYIMAVILNRLLVQRFRFFAHRSKYERNIAVFMEKLGNFPQMMGYLNGPVSLILA
jgi:hypothetical protein